jgi:CubicO group peptidase (beta-lactamase class C family)
MIRSLSCLFFILFFNLCVSAQPVRNALPVANPESAGFSTSFFTDLDKELADSIPCLGSFIVWSHNAIVYEGYFHEASAASSFNIKSITKSMVSAMAGIAKAKNLLPDLNKPVLSFFPEYKQSKPVSGTVWFSDDKAWNDRIRHQLTLKHLLTMQPGFDWNDYGQLVFAFINSSDPVRFTLELGFADTPGTKFVYCSAATSVFSAALAKAVRTDLKLFAKTNLFDPAGITLQRWDVDPVGRYVGCSEMFMTPRDLLRFGLIYLHEGKVGNKQVLTKEWVKESTEKQATLDYWDVIPNANGYGYYWWRRITNGHQAYIASGAGGQLIAVIPDLDMVVVATCFFNDKNRGREEIKRLQLFLDKVTNASKP